MCAWNPDPALDGVVEVIYAYSHLGDGCMRVIMLHWPALKRE